MGNAGSDPLSLTDVNGVLFFAADDRVTGRELWKSDGTTTGTVLVKDIRTGSASSEPSYLWNRNGKLFFSADDGVSGFELWQSDGSVAATTLVSDIRASGFGSAPHHLMNVGGNLFFKANDGFSGYELWKTDGTASGTVLVKDMNPGSIGSYGSTLLNANGVIYFSAADGSTGYELWRSDGTTSGTKLVRDIYRSFPSSAPRYLTNVNGTVFFTAEDGVRGEEVWKTDGTDNGTVVVREIREGFMGAIPRSLTSLNGMLVFSAHDGINGHELWVSNGTHSGTRLLADLNIGPWDSSPNYLLSIGDRVFFVAETLTTGFDLFTWNSAAPPATIMIPENSDLTSDYGQFSTSDPDYGQKFSYTLVSGIGDSDNSLFRVVNNGIRPTISLNYESRSQYSVRVRSTDNSGLWVEQQFVIQVTDVNEPATTISLSSGTIDENSPLSVSVSSIRTNDPDAGERYRFEFASGQGGDDNSLFSIAGDQLHANSILDYEQRASYSIRIRAIGADGGSIEQAMQIRVADGNEAPASVTLSGTSIEENQSPNTLVGIFSSIDPDAGSVFTYSLTAGSGAGDNHEFLIDGDRLKSAGIFNFEGRSQYFIRVRSTDSGGLFTERAFVISVTDVNEAPVSLTLSGSAIAENNPVGFVLGTVTSEDPDGGPITFGLAVGPGDLDNSSFAIVGNEVRVLSTTDHESRSSLSFRLRATDSLGLWMQKSFQVAVTNVNEAPSGFSLSSAAIAENSNTDTLIGIFTGVDPDVLDTLSFSLVPGDGDADNRSFVIAGNQLKSNAVFDFETKQSYSIRTRVSDLSGLYLERAFEITITDLEELEFTSPGPATVQQRPVISWTGTSHAGSREIWIAKSDSTTPVVRTILSQPTFAPATDLGIGRLTVWVRPVSGQTYGESSKPYVFNINTAAVLLPMNRSQETLRPEIRWQPLAGAARYDLRITDVSRGISQYLRSPGLIGTSFSPAAPMPLGTYRAWVRGLAADGTPASWSQVAEFRTMQAPIPIGPLGALLHDRPGFSWLPVPGATRYEVQVRDRQSYAVVHNVSLPATTTWTPGVRFSASRFTWWVIAINEFGLRSFWSAPADFNIGGEIRILSPSGTLSTRQPVITWSRVEDAVRYELWVTNVTLNTRPIDLKNLTSTSFIPSVPLASGHYRVWVRAVSSTGITGPWSTDSRFYLA